MYDGRDDFGGRRGFRGRRGFCGCRGYCRRRGCRSRRGRCGPLVPGGGFTKVCKDCGGGGKRQSLSSKGTGCGTE